MAYHLHKAQLAMKEVESSLQEAGRQQGKGDLESLTKARETMRALEADLSRALQDLGGSSDAATVASSTTGGGEGSTILTPTTSVQGDSTTAGSGEAPQLTVPVAPGREPRKLTLAQRKEMRDTFGAASDGYAKRLSELLRVPWTIHVDHANMLSYLPDEEHPGELLVKLYDGAVSGMEEFLKTSPDADDARAAINRAAAHHVVTVEPYSADETASCDFDNGKLRLLFKPDSFVWGANNALQYLAEALHKAESGPATSTTGEKAPQLPFQTRYGIKKEYDAEIATVEAAAKKQLGRAVTFDPNFVANFAALKAYEDADEDNRVQESDWQKDLGRATLKYFEGLVGELEDKKFSRDDMLQEGFLDAVDTATVTVRVVDKKLLTGGSDLNDLVIEKGVCVLRAEPERWGLWQRDVARDLMNLL